MKQTAVQWFSSKLMSLNISPSEMRDFLEWFEEAKDMEERQIKDAFLNGWVNCYPTKDSTDYYNETYKSENKKPV